MYSKELVELAMRTLKCSQKELASRLEVSPTQISKWKKGEHMSQGMEERLKAISDIGDKDASFVLRAGSVDDANRWEKLISVLFESANGQAETGYDMSHYQDLFELFCSFLFDALVEMGVELPKSFPAELVLNYDSLNDDDWELLTGKNLYSSLIYNVLLTLNDVWGFYAAYVSELMFDEDLRLDETDAENIEAQLVHLAACKTDVDEKLAPKAAKFRRKILGEYEEWLTIVKDRAFRAGVPVKAELMDLVHSTAGELGGEAEAKRFGFNTSRIHPDIYMNELLVGMRIIHQVLPAILNKLGLEKELKLDS